MRTVDFSLPKVYKKPFPPPLQPSSSTISNIQDNKPTNPTNSKVSSNQSRCSSPPFSPPSPWLWPSLPREQPPPSRPPPSRPPPPPSLALLLRLPQIAVPLRRLLASTSSTQVSSALPSSVSYSFQRLCCTRRLSSPSETSPQHPQPTMPIWLNNCMLRYQRCPGTLNPCHLRSAPRRNMLTTSTERSHQHRHHLYPRHRRGIEFPSSLTSFLPVIPIHLKDPPPLGRSEMENVCSQIHSSKPSTESFLLDTHIESP